jgi:hypothetical protein
MLLLTVMTRSESEFLSFLLLSVYTSGSIVRIVIIRKKLMNQAKSRRRYILLSPFLMSRKCTDNQAESKGKGKSTDPALQEEQKEAEDDDDDDEDEPVILEGRRKRNVVNYADVRLLSSLHFPSLHPSCPPCFSNLGDRGDV